MMGSEFGLPTWRRMQGAILGGLVAGLVLSVWMLIGEVVSGHPSELIVMERQIAGWLSHAAPGAGTPTISEEYVGNFAHLLLSALAGATYALIWRSRTSIVVSGLVFGALFYGAAHAVVGPVSGLTPPMWQLPGSGFLLGCLINGLFGLCTAFFADRFSVEGHPAADGSFSARALPVR